MNHEELKPCPFCGGKAYITPNTGDPEEAHEVDCYDCGGYVWGDTKEAAIRNWNMRQIPDTLAPHAWSKAVGKLLHAIADINRLLTGRKVRHND